MAAYRRVYDSRHLQADCQEPTFLTANVFRCCLLTVMMLVAGLHLVSRRCFLGVSAAVFATIFTVVLTYIISTAAMSTTRCCSLDALSLHRLITSVTGYVRWASGHRAARCGHVTLTQG